VFAVSLDVVQDLGDDVADLLRDSGQLALGGFQMLGMTLVTGRCIRHRSRDWCR
jgi:hypothetical protein